MVERKQQKRQQVGPAWTCVTGCGAGGGAAPPLPACSWSLKFCILSWSLLTDRCALSWYSSLRSESICACGVTACRAKRGPEKNQV